MDILQVCALQNSFLLNGGDIDTTQAASCSVAKPTGSLVLDFLLLYNSDQCASELQLE
jgi:hypothetical protein